MFGPAIEIKKWRYPTKMTVARLLLFNLSPLRRRMCHNTIG